MDRRAGTRRAAGPLWVVASLALVAALATAVLAGINHASVRSLDAASLDEIILPISFSILGALVATRHPRNPVGWLYLFMALDMGISGVAIQYARLAQVTTPGSLPGAGWAQWTYSWSERLVYPSGAAALLLLVLPDGHLASTRWRGVVWACLVVTPLSAALAAADPRPLSTTPSDLRALPNPLGLAAVGTLTNAIAAISGLIALILLVIAAAAPLVRLRRSRGETRQQLKWIAFAVAAAAVLSAGTFIIGGAILSTRAAGSISTVSVVLGFGIALPVATGIAISRYRLYDIDIVISRTLVYGALAAFITAAYVGIVVGVGSLVGTGGSPNAGLSIVATAVVAGAFQPVRERLQRVANGLVYGSRATPYEVLSHFSRNVGEGYAVDEVLPRMARVLAEGTGAARADVWLLADGTLRPAASCPTDAEAPSPVPVSDAESPLTLPLSDRAVAVRHHGELLGMLSIAKRSGDTVTPIEEKLLADLGHQAGLVLRNVRLTAELLDRIDELRSSRQRLVSAQDEERRRLERDLHDGAQQHLVALRIKLGLAETLAGRDPQGARVTLGELKADADEALDALRDLSHGIYPPLLAARGLVAALEAHGRRGTVPVDVRGEGVTRYDQATESCVYFCCLEALQNVQKHAGAQLATVLLEDSGGLLRFHVTDDGHGFDARAAVPGIGLRSVQDRVDALGGRLDVRSQVGGGTVLRGEVPAAQATSSAQPARADRKTRAAFTRR